MTGEAVRAGEAFFRQRFWRGIAAALAGASLWGFSGACAQFLIAGYGASPAFITAARMLGAGLLFLAVLLVRQRAHVLAMLRDRATLARLAVLGVVGLYPSQITYTIVVEYTNAGTATVLQCMGIVFVMLYACLSTRKLPQRRELIGLVLAMAATWLIATQADPGAFAVPVEGLLWSVANGLAVAFYIVYPKRLFAQWGSLPVTGLGMFAGGLAAFGMWLAGAAWGQPPVVPGFDAAGWAVVAAIIAVGTFAAYGLYLHGVSVVGPVKGSLLGTMEPLGATVFAALWLGTVFTGADWAGFVLMVAMIFLVTGEKPQPKGEAADTPD